MRTHRSEDSVGQSAGQRVETIWVQLVSVVGLGFLKKFNNKSGSKTWFALLFQFYWFTFRTSYE